MSQITDVSKMSRGSFIFMSKGAKHIYVQSCQESSHLKNEHRLAFNYGFLWEFGFDDFVITLKFLIVGKGWIKLRFSQHLLVFNLFRPSRCSLSLPCDFLWKSHLPLIADPPILENNKPSNKTITPIFQFSTTQKLEKTVRMVFLRFPEVENWHIDSNWVKWMGLPTET